MQIRPANAKSLWDSVRIARDEDTNPIPNEMSLGNDKYKNEEIADAFSDYFKNKVDQITAECQTDDTVYNGIRLLNVTNENFMTEQNVRKCLKGLKIKNCEGVDRIPLRILNDGAEILTSPITRLLNIIYATKKIPAQWR